MSRADELLCGPDKPGFGSDEFMQPSFFLCSTSVASHSSTIFFYPAGKVEQWYADESNATQRC